MKAALMLSRWYNKPFPPDSTGPCATERVGNVSLKLYFHSEKWSCESPDVRDLHLISYKSKQFAGKLWLCFSGCRISSALIPAPLAVSTGPAAAAQGFTKARRCARVSLGNLGATLGPRREEQQKPLSLARLSGLSKVPQNASKSPHVPGTVQISHSISAQFGLNRLTSWCNWLQTGRRVHLWTGRLHFYMTNF